MWTSCTVAEQRTAELDVILYESRNNELKTYEYNLEGKFSAAGSTGSAEGTIVQVNCVLFRVVRVCLCR